MDARAKRGEIVERQIANALGLPTPVCILHLALGKHPRQPPIGLAVFGVGEEFLAAQKPHATADQRPEGCLLRLDMKSHHASQTVEIGAAEGVIAQCPGFLREIYGIRSAAQKGETGGKAELDKPGAGIGRKIPVFRQGPARDGVVVFRHEEGTPPPRLRRSPGVF